jgi:hypothetical protein
VVPVTANGKTKNVTKQQLLVKNLVAQALEGKSKAVSLVWKLIKDYGWDKTPEDVITYTISKKEIAELEAFLHEDSNFKHPGESHTSGPQSNYQATHQSSSRGTAP